MRGGECWANAKNWYQYIMTKMPECQFSDRQ